MVFATIYKNSLVQSINHNQKQKKIQNNVIFAKRSCEYTETVKIKPVFANFEGAKIANGKRYLHRNAAMNHG